MTRALKAPAEQINCASFADAVRENDIALVFDCARGGQNALMFDSGKRPSRGNGKNIRPLVDSEHAINFRESQIVTNG